MHISIMRNKAYVAIATASLFAVATSLRAQSGVVINEVMQSNIDYLMVDNDFPDSWVELYNSSNSDVCLSGYYISEKASLAKGYMLPSEAIVPAKGHLLIYCDKENHGLHASFRIDAGKASVYLLDPQGNVVDGLTLGEMPVANVAYGRVTDGSEEWQYELEPTAGASNAGGGAAEVLPNPVFSMPGGLYADKGCELTISLPEGVPEDALIYYTVDGKEPTAESASGKQISLTVDGTMVVRAKIISQSGGGLVGRSLTQSYIFHPREVTMPVISLVSEQNYFYDSTIGILSAAVNDGMPNYMQKWRRPVNVEYYAAEDGKQVFNQLGETAISGVSTRENVQKSMKIYANKRFGKKNYKGKFWDDKPEVNKVKSFVLRSGGNNSFLGRINDALVQTLFGTSVANLDWQAYKPVIVYLNGRFIGEFAMRERSDEDFVAANYEDIEDIEQADETSYQEPENGSLFADFRTSYMRSDVTYDELASQMDVDNFAKVLAAEIYAQNTDFPTNNVAMWRPVEEGGKWRWILKDLDRFAVEMMMYPPTFDMFRYLFEPDELMYSGMHHFDLYKKMISFPEFRESFIDKLSVYLGDFLCADNVLAHIESMDAEIYEELKATYKAYNVKFNSFTMATDYMKAVVQDRPAILYAQMADFFGLGSDVPVRVIGKDGAMLINGTTLTTDLFDGCYFLNRPLRLSAGIEGCVWKMTITHSDGTVEEHDFGNSDISVVLAEYLSAGDAVLFEVTVLKEDPKEDDPSDEPTDEPSDEPSDNPSDEPSDNPDDEPSDNPSDEPSGDPGDDPSDNPSDEPSDDPNDEPSDEPSDKPADDPDPEPEIDVAVKDVSVGEKRIVFYDMNGIRIGNGMLKKGRIYIVNGKKTLY